MCRYPDCEWGPSTTSYRAKHEKGVHGKLFTAKGPIHNQDAGPSQGSGLSGTTDTGFFIFARGKDTGIELRGSVDLPMQRNLSPLVSNYIDGQAEEASGSESSIPSSEPMHSGED